MLKHYYSQGYCLSPYERTQRAAELLYYASDLVESIGLRDEMQLEDALRRAFKVCTSLRIPIEDNFASVYRFDGTEMVPDWKLSALASYLVIVNADPENSKVARAQLYFTLKNFSDVEI